jgi:hypothetical protein
MAPSDQVISLRIQSSGVRQRRTLWGDLLDLPERRAVPHERNALSQQVRIRRPNFDRQAHVVFHPSTGAMPENVSNLFPILQT